MLDFSEAVEDAAAIFANLNDEDYKALAGRSTVNIKHIKGKYGGKLNTTTKEIDAPLDAEAKRLLLQHRRLVNIRQCSNKYKLININASNTTANIRQGFKMQIQTNFEAFIQHTMPADNLEELTNHFDQQCDDLPYHQACRPPHVKLQSH